MARHLQPGGSVASRTCTLPTSRRCIRLGKVRGEAFLDAFNVLNGQGATRNEDRVAGSGTIASGEATDFRAPRRFYLGARVSF